MKPATPVAFFLPPCSRSPRMTEIDLSIRIVTRVIRGQRMAGTKILRCNLPKSEQKDPRGDDHYLKSALF